MSGIDFFEKIFLHFSGSQTEYHGNSMVLKCKRSSWWKTKNYLLEANSVLVMEIYIFFFCLQNQKTLNHIMLRLPDNFASKNFDFDFKA